jgi:hypothetical protein
MLFVTTLQFRVADLFCSFCSCFPTGQIKDKSVDKFDEMDVDGNDFDNDLQLSDDDEFHHPDDVSGFSKDQSGSGLDHREAPGKYDDWLG